MISPHFPPEFGWHGPGKYPMRSLLSLRITAESRLHPAIVIATTAENKNNLLLMFSPRIEYEASNFASDDTNYKTVQ